MKWGLVCNYHVKKACSNGKDIFIFLKENGEVFAEDKFAEKQGFKGYSMKDINKKADIVVTVGGDGTILRALEKIEKPIFAINSGGMGFLSEVESKYAKEGLQRVIEGKYNIEERSKLKVTVDGKRLPDAANEVTVQTSRIAKMIYLQVLVDDDLLETFGADGVIIATPTGSTSYALSAGGPILDPGVNAMVIAPLAPFKLAGCSLPEPLGSSSMCFQLWHFTSRYFIFLTFNFSLILAQEPLSCGCLPFLAPVRYWLSLIILLRFV